MAYQHVKVAGASVDGPILVLSCSANGWRTAVEVDADTLCQKVHAFGSVAEILGLRSSKVLVHPKWIHTVDSRIADQKETENRTYQSNIEHIRKSSSAKPRVKDDIPCKDVYF